MSGAHTMLHKNQLGMNNTKITIDLWLYIKGLVLFNNKKMIKNDRSTYNTMEKS